MTDFNNNKFVPKAPETYTVSYLETGQVKKSSLSPAARAKVINRSGSNYLSEKEGYGPCDVCNKPEKTVEFKLGCPSCSNSAPSYWHHENSGCENSRMLITSRGYLSCGGCGIGYNMSYWRFRCSNHPGEPRSMNQDCWNESMAHALLLGNVNSAIQDLSIYVACHKKEFGFKEN